MIITHYYANSCTPIFSAHHPPQTEQQGLSLLSFFSSYGYGYSYGWGVVQSPDEEKQF
jgi:hypothetical protein